MATFITAICIAFAALACLALASDIIRAYRHFRNLRNADKRAAQIWQETETE